MDEAERRAAERRPTAKLGGGERLAVLALAGAGVLWGVSFLFGKWALEEMGPAHVTLVRFALALAVLLVQGLGQRAKTPRAPPTRWRSLRRSRAATRQLAA